MRVVDASTGVIQTIAGTPGQRDYGGNVAMAVRYVRDSRVPDGLALDGNGDLFIEDGRVHTKGQPHNRGHPVDCGWGTGRSSMRSLRNSKLSGHAGPYAYVRVSDCRLPRAIFTLD